MQDEDDDLRVVLGVLFGLLALVIGLVIGMGVYSLNRATAVPVVEAAPTPIAEVMRAAADSVPTEAMAFTDVAPQGDAQVKVYFAVGETGLSNVAAADLAGFTEMAADKLDAMVVLVSGFHDASGSAEVNAEIAKTRAMNVLNALIAAGIPADKVLLSKPAQTLGDGDAAEARRVEVRLQ
ncbi:MAG TPA: OmpA family protein [Denitromonas sp.]|uniref:OmpA family protein n=1 Tax=Denitromonas sp. TaxID=2734609 RepID=UPI002BF6AB58|nr:OmpA family protein [Zoogloeaceae bacterium]HPR07773.1 OmpA family protein [Denitromonas sp.]HQU89637.1 OmpA family protein [Denitromonas sp.]HQV14947.1 OmpA family protein [Denitromonas sp.]